MIYAILQNLAKIPVILVGWVLVPFLWNYRHYDIHHLKIVHPWMTPWLNPEDWTGGYRDFPPDYNCVPPNLYEGSRTLWDFYRYHAWRNGGDGLRNYDWHLCLYDHSKMEIVKEHEKGYTVRQGKYLSIGRWVGDYFIKFGWRQTPTDVRGGYDPKSIRWNYGAGPAWSFRKAR